MRRRPRHFEPLERRDLLATDLLEGVALGTPRSSNPREFIAAGDYVYFTAQPSVGINELWRTDGTPAGTISLQYTGGRHASEALGDALVFQTGPHGQLWTTRGTPESLTQLTAADNRQRVLDTGLVVFEDHLYFMGEDANRERAPERPGIELMRTDGTPEGTGYFGISGYRSSGKSGRMLGVWNDRVHYFLEGRTVPQRSELRQTTDGGTQVFPDYAGQIDGLSFAANYEGTLLGANLAVFRHDLVWANSETLDKQYVRINPRSVLGSAPANFLSTPAGVFFTASDGTHGRELWLTDGKFEAVTEPAEGTVQVFADAEMRTQVGRTTGTRMVADLAPGRADGSPDWLVWHQDALFFVAKDQLWKFDPDSQAVTQLRDFNNPEPTVGSPGWLTALGESLYFVASGAAGEEIWKTDGTPEGTTLAVDLEPGPKGSEPRSLFAHQGRLLFTARQGLIGHELWQLDPATDQVRLLKDIHPGVSGPHTIPRDLHVYQGVAFFRFDDRVHGTELWRTDGTKEGTFLFKDIRPGIGSSGPKGFFEFNDWLYFTANDGQHGNELWRTDGTPENTTLVKDIWPGSDAVVNEDSLVAMGDHIYFMANDGEHGMELWRSDGTAAGTARISDIRPGPGHALVDLLTASEDAVYLFDAYDGRDPGQARAIWKFDGEKLVRFAAHTTDAALRRDLVALSAVGDEVYVIDGRLNLYQYQRRGFERLHHSVVSDVLPISADELAFATVKDGAYVYGPLQELEQVGGGRLASMVALGDTVFYWPDDTAASGFVRSFSVGERIPTTLLENVEVQSVTPQADHALLDVITTNGREAWRTDGSPLRTQKVAAVPDHLHEMILLGDRLLYIAPLARGGESLFVADKIAPSRPQVTPADVDALFSHARRGLHAAEHDWNGDERVDQRDVDTLFEDVLGTHRADFDLNGQVDLADFRLLAAHFGKAPAAWSAGDANGDAVVDFTDFLMLAVAISNQRTA